MVRIERCTSDPIIRIDYNDTPIPIELQDQVEHAWTALQQSNSKYFNGPMLSYLRYEPSSGVISARAEQYKHHAVRDSVDLDVRLLAVTGLIVAQNPESQDRYLLGKRSASTHRYGGLWEFGPCGGIDVPEDKSTELNMNRIHQELCRESIEEIGVDLSDAQVSPLAIVHDDAAGSVDLVLQVQLDSIPELSKQWEYEDLRWVTLDELQSWIGSDPNAFIPTTREIARVLLTAAD